MEVIKQDSANITIAEVVERNTLVQKIDAEAKKVAKTIKLDGFRAGKVPVSVVKNMHKEALKQEAMSEILRASIAQAIKEYDIDEKDILGDAIVRKFDEKVDKIEIEFTLAKRPKLDLDGYEECVPAFDAPVVSEEDLKARVDSVLNMSATFVEDNSKALENGDLANINFEGFVDGEAFSGGQAENYDLEIGSKSFIDTFEEQLVGLKVGDEREITVKFPDSYGSSELAGKDAMFKIKVNSIKNKKTPTSFTADILKNILPDSENPTEEELIAKIKGDLENEKLDKLYNESLREKFTDALLAKFDFAVPENILEQEVNIQLDNKASSMSEEEINSYKEDQSKVEALQKELEPEAKKSVRLTFIIDTLATKNEIEVKDEEIQQVIYFEAMQSGQDFNELYKKYQEQGVLPMLKMSLVENKLYKKIFASKIESK